MDLQDFAGFENSPGEPQIRLGRGRIAAGVIVHQHKSESAKRDNRFKDFPWMGERFVESAFSHGNDLDELLFGVEQDHADRFVRKKPHLGAETGYRPRAIDDELRAFVAQGDGGQAQGADQPGGFGAREERQQFLNRGAG